MRDLSSRSISKFGNILILQTMFIVLSAVLAAANNLRVSAAASEAGESALAGVLQLMLAGLASSLLKAAGLSTPTEPDLICLMAATPESEGVVSSSPAPAPYALYRGHVEHSSRAKRLSKMVANYVSDAHVPGITPGIRCDAFAPAVIASTEACGGTFAAFTLDVLNNTAQFDLPIITRLNTLFEEACQAYIAARDAEEAAFTEDLKRFGMAIAALAGCVVLGALGSMARGYCVERSRIRAARAAHESRVGELDHLLDAPPAAEAGVRSDTTGRTTYGSASAAAATASRPAATCLSRLGLCCVRTAKAPYVAGETLARWQEGIEMTDMRGSSVG